MYCPYCTAPYTPNSAGLESPELVNCRNCGCRFCTLCQRQWDVNHDIQRCIFEDRQRQIATLVQRRSPSDMIAQCPTCKIPYLQSNQCESMNCGKPMCHFNWCFSECKAYISTWQPLAQTRLQVLGPCGYQSTVRKLRLSELPIHENTL